MTATVSVNKIIWILFFSILSLTGSAKGARLLRQPAPSANLMAFEYGGDIRTCERSAGNARHINSPAALKGNPHFSPDGKWLAFNSNRSGIQQVYVVPAAAGTPARLTWYPPASIPRGWSADGKTILYASPGESGPTKYPFLDGGAMTAPDNGIFDPLHNKWIGENVGIAPYIEQKITSLPYGRGVTCNWSVG